MHPNPVQLLVILTRTQKPDEADPRRLSRTCSVSFPPPFPFELLLFLARPSPFLSVVAIPSRERSLVSVCLVIPQRTRARRGDEKSSVDKNAGLCTTKANTGTRRCQLGSRVCRPLRYWAWTTLEILVFVLPLMEDGQNFHRRTT